MMRFSLAMALLIAACSCSRPTPVPDPPLPDLLRPGRDLETARQELASACGRTEERRYTGAAAAPFREQIQIDCHDLLVLGAHRKVELLFNEGTLGFLWILIASDEQETVREALSGAFGEIVFDNGNYRVFASATAALRRRPPEVLIATRPILGRITGYESETP